MNETDFPDPRLIETTSPQNQKFRTFAPRVLMTPTTQAIKTMADPVPNSNSIYQWVDRILKLLIVIATTIGGWQTVNNNTQAERQHMENLQVLKDNGQKVYLLGK